MLRLIWGWGHIIAKWCPCSLLYLRWWLCSSRRITQSDWVFLSRKSFSNQGASSQVLSVNCKGTFLGGSLPLSNMSNLNFLYLFNHKIILLNDLTWATLMSNANYCFKLTLYWLVFVLTGIHVHITVCTSPKCRGRGIIVCVFVEVKLNT